MSNEKKILLGLFGVKGTTMPIVIVGDDEDEPKIHGMSQVFLIQWDTLMYIILSFLFLSETTGDR